MNVMFLFSDVVAPPDVQAAPDSSVQQEDMGLYIVLFVMHVYAYLFDCLVPVTCYNPGRVSQSEKELLILIF